jgi:hypothetical protein
MERVFRLRSHVRQQSNGRVCIDNWSEFGGPKQELMIETLWGGILMAVTT